jgi:putative membrane protein
MEARMDVGALVLATHEHWAGHAGGWWPIVPIFWILFFVGLFFLLGRRARFCRGGYSRASGESVLAERYARGEVSEQEYRDRLDVLRERRG